MTTLHVFDCIVPAPFGFVGVTVTRAGDQLTLLTEEAAVQAHAAPRARQIALAVLDYLTTPLAPLPSADIHVGTPFQQRVWQAIARIPVGQTRTYGQLAACLQSGPRAVANACGANPAPLLVPCHRVVASRGLGGFMQGHPQGLALKRWLLAHEQHVGVGE